MLKQSSYCGDFFFQTHMYVVIDTGGTFEEELWQLNGISS
jgi:hypothetical protein